ncbi:hypothetical protein [Corallococcus exercitus]|uniref:hypothetical protein n=1 Tax=Corallococcus exercitus TaxID=2316736 RepID=UPI0035D4F5F6
MSTGDQQRCFRFAWHPWPTQGAQGDTVCVVRSCFSSSQVTSWCLGFVSVTSSK